MNANEVIQISLLTSSDADELLRFIRTIQGDDPLCPVTVVAPSNYALLSLRHRLGLSGIANVQFMVFPRLAELLGAPSLSAQGMRPLTNIFDSAVVREVASEATGMLEPVRGHPSTHLSLRRTFRQLRHATEDALNTLDSQGDLRSETIALYRKYREYLEDRYDDEDLAEAAAAAVRKGSAPGLEDLGFIVFFRVRGLTPSETSLVRALAEAGKCAVLPGLTGDAQADRSSHALAKHLHPAFGAPQPRGSANEGTSTAKAHLLIAPDAHQELRWVIRRIMQRAESGTPFHRMAALYRKEAPYGTLIREELALAGIPVAGPNTALLAETAVGSALTGLLNLHEADFARDAVMAWLTGCPLRPPSGTDAVSFNPTLWDSISKRAGIVRGAAQWEHRLAQFAEQQTQTAGDGEAKGEITEARANRMRADARTARQLQCFIANLVQATDASGNTSWKDYSEWSKELLDSYLPVSEQRTYDRIKRILDELQSLDSVSPNPSYEVFLRALNEALQVSVGHLGSVGHGVFVAPFKLAAAMSFDVVHLVGMIEGAVPPAVRDDPLIPERDRERAGGAAAGLPVQQQQKDDERYEYLVALATAPEYTLSYPVADPAGQRENFPSRWFLEEATRLNGGKPVFTSDLPKLSGKDWLTTITSMQRSLDTALAATHADTHDYNMERLQSWKDAGKRADAHPLAAEGVLAASMRLGAARFDKQFTEWDGNLSAAGANFADMLTGRPQSPTSLERWAKCPMSYFLGNVLYLSAEDNPEDIYDITPLERGSLVHAILEEFIESARNQGSLPAPSEAWNDRQRAELRRIAEKRFADAESRGVTGKAVLWQIAREEILNDLETFLDKDLQMRREFGVSPIDVEASFGIGENDWQPAELTLPDGAQVRFRGKIDRIDANASGNDVLVLDYKTGGSKSYDALNKDPIDRGKRLQLAIYSLAARQAMGEDTTIQAAYWFVSGKGNFTLMPSKEPVNIADEKVMSRFGEGITTIVDGIRQGLFPANPGEGDPNNSQYGESNCRWCDFKTLCPSRRDVQWERKKHASELADYVQLAEGDLTQ